MVALKEVPVTETSSQTATNSAATEEKAKANPTTPSNPLNIRFRNIATLLKWLRPHAAKMTCIWPSQTKIKDQSFAHSAKALSPQKVVCQKPYYSAPQRLAHWARKPLIMLGFSGAPDTIRTCDPCLRSTPEGSDPTHSTPRISDLQRLQQK